MWLVKKLVGYREEVEPRPDVRVVWVSELALCLRYAYHARAKGVERSFAALAAIESGRAIHELVKRVLKGEERVVGFEVPVARLERACGRWVLVKGRVDILVEDDNGDVAVVEVKTGSAIREWHRLQALLYAYLVGAPKAYIVLVDRDNGGVEAEEVSVDHLAAARIYRERLEKLVCSVKHREEPEAEKWLGFCRWCPLTCPHDEDA